MRRRPLARPRKLATMGQTRTMPTLSALQRGCLFSVIFRTVRNSGTDSSNVWPPEQREATLSLLWSSLTPIWVFPKIGDPNIVPEIVGSLLKGPQSKVPRIFCSPYTISKVNFFLFVTRILDKQPASPIPFNTLSHNINAPVIQGLILK